MIHGTLINVATLATICVVMLTAPIVVGDGINLNETTGGEFATINKSFSWPLVTLNYYFGIELTQVENNTFSSNVSRQSVFLLDTGSDLTILLKHTLRDSFSDIPGLGIQRTGLITDGIHRNFTELTGSLITFQLPALTPSTNQLAELRAIVYKTKYYEELIENHIELSEFISMDNSLRQVLEAFRWEFDDGNFIADGVLALGYPQLAQRSRRGFPLPFVNQLWSSISAPLDKYLTLSFRKDASWSPFLHVGSFELDMYPSPNMSRILWSERQPQTNPVYHMATIHRVELCGVDLFANSDVSHGFALLDTGALCLRLPSDMYKIATAWLPLDCAGNSELERSGLCVINRTEGTELPSIDFSLTYVGPRMRLPLEQLVISRGNVEHLCLLNGQSDSTIYFGSMVLSGFDAFVLDYQNNRVGFVENERSASRGVQSETCEAISNQGSCDISQVFDVLLNSCEDIECGLLDFRHPKYPTRQCNSELSFLLLIIVPILVCSCCDMALMLHMSRFLHSAEKKVMVEKLS